jgi:hypothetical protein
LRRRRARGSTRHRQRRLSLWANSSVFFPTQQLCSDRLELRTHSLRPGKSAAPFARRDYGQPSR